MKSGLLSNIVTAQISAVLAFIVVPVFMISQAPKEFYFLDIPTFLSSGLLFAVIFSGILSLVLVLIHGLRLHKIANSFSLFVLAWIVIAGFILPVCASTGMVDPEDIPTNRINFAIVAIISLGLSAFASTSFKKVIVAFLSFVVLSTIISTIYSFYSYSNVDTSGESSDHLALSNKKNILVVSFDGLPGEIISEVIKSNSTISSTFKDFKFFDNSVSQSPSTEASIMGEVYGVQDYKSLGERQSDVNQILDKDLNKYLLTSFVKDSYIYGPYPHNIAKQITLQPPTIDTYQAKEETFDFFSYSIVRLATNRALRFSKWNQNVRNLKAYLIGPPSSALGTKLKNHVGPKWDRPMNADILNYDYWVDNLDVSGKEFSIRYLHFTFTHFPVDFDASCTFKGDDNQWYINHQSVEGIHSQAICALEKFSTLLSKLKSLGIYDQSLVVLKSDHGEPSNYFSNYPNNLRINGQGGNAETTFGYSRYRPTLMIKDFGANNPKISYQNELVLLNDLAKTLCANSGLKIRCDYFHGINLLSKELGTIDEPYYIYVVKNSESSFGFDKHVSVKITSRKFSLIKAMEASTLITLSPSVQETGWTPK